MFDIGFWELVVVGVVAIVAIGPEQLPRVAKGVGKFVANFERAVQKTKNDFAREVDLVHSTQFPEKKTTEWPPPLLKEETSSLKECAGEGKPHVRPGIFR